MKCMVPVSAYSIFDSPVLLKDALLNFLGRFFLFLQIG